MPALPGHCTEAQRKAALAAGNDVRLRRLIAQRLSNAAIPLAHPKRQIRFASEGSSVTASI